VTVLRSLAFAFTETWRNKRLLLVYYLASLVFGLLVAVPAAAALSRFLGRSLLGAKLAGPFDPEILAIFVRHQPESVWLLAVFLAIAWMLHKIFFLFLSGGTISLFVVREPYQPRDFWSAAAEHFGPFLLILLWTLPVLVVLMSIQFAVPLLRHLIWAGDPPEAVLFWSVVLRVVLGLTGLFLAGLVFDYARIHVVSMRESRSWMTMLVALRFAFTRIHLVVALALSVLMAGFGLLVVQQLLSGLLSGAGVVALLALVLFQQLTVAARMFLRIALVAGEVRLYGLTT
jgi:hypothetical protein